MNNITLVESDKFSTSFQNALSNADFLDSDNISDKISETEFLKNLDKSLAFIAEENASFSLDLYIELNIKASEGESSTILFEVNQLRKTSKQILVKFNNRPKIHNLYFIVTNHFSVELNINYEF
jgi:hypothetical protein